MLYRFRHLNNFKRPHFLYIYSRNISLRPLIRIGIGSGFVSAGSYVYTKYNQFTNTINNNVNWVFENINQAKDSITNYKLHWVGAEKNHVKNSQNTQSQGETSGEGNNDAQIFTTAGIAGYVSSDDEKTEDDKESEFSLIIKKMIDLRNILKALGQDNMITLPSIVVVGSQSSGKSSVLESIVGHEFLPKGSNMVTRRPLELTLVNCETEEDYAEFPNLGLGKIYDFKKVQKTLTDLNNAVPEKECISNSPIELYVYSKNVPDLSLVDLPGYIQITSKDQPEKLREKIIDLCDNYIKDKNIILAVSAADVDLANSEALKRSRAADPLGTRTIGVITKMDLVDPQSGYQILNNKSYPLPMGYIGVVCKPGTSASFETNYFKQNKVYADDSSVSVSSLRKKLIKTLEASMKDSLSSVNEAVLSELSDVKYQFKVLFNDREISPEGGSNMVTRRPLELTLVNCETEEDYAEFPNLGLGKIYDFKKVQKTLTDLNNAVPEKECISNSPIELYVYSKNVPDLSLVDLPGYIQITSKDQPEKLREKIIDLCDNYIKDKNIILAVSAADVDLANSEALKRSRAADPLGTRTIVDPQSGYQILNNTSYPLPMGYIVVVFLFNDREISPEGYVSTILAQFKSNLTSVASQFSKSSIRKLIRDRLEKSLIEIIAQNYCFNPSIKALDKESASDPYWIRQVQIGSSSLVKSEIVKNCTMDLVNEMESQFSSLVNKEPLVHHSSTLSQMALDKESASDPYWIRQVQIGSSSLAKSGIGKNCTIDLVNEMESQFSSLVNKEPFVHHSSTLSQMVQLVQKKLRNKLYITIEQIENALKPLKCDLEFTPNDWSVARSRVLFLLEKKLKQTELILEEIHSRYDKRTLLNAVEYLKKQ
ncbi:Dynamin, GTPase domain-containing protein, partial [Rozella allomycis CSF55]